MSYYKTCENCGSNLDPGEICDCTKKVLPILDQTTVSSNPVKAKLPSSSVNKRKNGNMSYCNKLNRNVGG